MQKYLKPGTVKKFLGIVVLLLAVRMILKLLK
jgi:uncharacterized membrane protein YfcA